MKGRGDEQREGAAKSGEHGHLGRSDTRGPSKVPSRLVTDRMFRYLQRVNLLVQQLKAAIAELAKRKGLHGARVLDLGCAAGRTAFDCAAAAPGSLVLGIDGNLALLRLARRAATRGEVAYGRRRIGLVYDHRRFPAVLPGRERVDFWACDAAALPFAPGRADLVLALNLLDCVPDPVGLLHAMAAALRPGGALLLATPFDWAARATPAAHWIGGHSQRGDGRGAAEPLLLALLSGTHDRSVPGLAVAGVGEHAWHTRLHDRSMVLYQTHLAAAYKSTSIERDGQDVLKK